ncbi:hypothetical protein F5Y16DRAFT_369659 [Xylariaceae sp. FL0255]|nr:hypothetical protein F5Y16DRAFT_369659 [Xylariaceae sp. FL0255]
MTTTTTQIRTLSIPTLSPSYSPPSKSQPTHSCNHPRTSHPLPKLVSFLKYHGHAEISYSITPGLPLPHKRDDLGLESACETCQMTTQLGVEEAIAAIACGPDSLVEHDVVVWAFLALVEARVKQMARGSVYQHRNRESITISSNSRSDNDDDDMMTPIATAPEEFYEDDMPTPTQSTFAKTSAALPVPTWDWEYIWQEWAKTFELRRDRVNIPEVLGDLSRHPRFQEFQHAEWWISVLQKLGHEALQTYRNAYITSGLALDPGPTCLVALHREAECIQSEADLEGFYRDIDTRAGLTA